MCIQESNVVQVLSMKNRTECPIAALSFIGRTGDMKTIKYIIAIFGASLLLSSCEDMLDRFPQDKLSPETFLSTETELRSYTNALYPLFPTGFFSDGQSDAVIGRNLSDEMRGARTIASGESDWSWTYLRRINTFFEYAGNCKDEKLRNE